MSHSRQPARPRISTLHPAYPMVIGIALTLVAGCHKGADSNSAVPDMMPAGTVAPQFDSAPIPTPPPPSSADIGVPTMGVAPPVFRDAGPDAAKKPQKK